MVKGCRYSVFRYSLFRPFPCQTPPSCTEYHRMLINRKAVQSRNLSASRGDSGCIARCPRSMGNYSMAASGILHKNRSFWGGYKSADVVYSYMQTEG